jgi:hypothetical protein
MYVCMYVCNVYVYVYVCMYVMYVCMCVYIFTYVYMYARMYVCTCNKTGNVRLGIALWGLMQPLFQWNSETYYLFRVCVCSVRCPSCSLMRRIVLSSVASLAQAYFSALSHKRQDFPGGRGGLLNTKCVF